MTLNISIHHPRWKDYGTTAIVPRHDCPPANGSGKERINGVGFSTKRPPPSEAESQASCFVSNMATAHLECSESCRNKLLAFSCLYHLISTSHTAVKYDL
ncbi:hypothetical protein CRENBAI_002060 [Crenichthys baileyi]|uniref:Uncharacterized protein n=1 Tax=Crenichthys baileyi TaxID=28760 RepID=A0AAV9RSP7_9TELE